MAGFPAVNSNKFKTRTHTDYIVVHCAATPADMDVGAYEIDRWHRKKGWLMIGYHYVIRRDGTLEEGRAVDKMGAHVRGYNNRSIGICMVGGVDANKRALAENNFTDDQFRTLSGLVKYLRGHHRDAKIVGHTELDPMKACPSFDVQAWLKTID